MTTVTLLLLGFIAGGLVNWLVEAVPPASLPRHRRQKRGAYDWFSWRNAAISLAAIGLVWLAYREVGWQPRGLLIALEACFFLAIALIDLEHHLVLNRMIGPALPLFFAANLLVGDTSALLLLLGGLVGGGLLLVIALVVPGAMGMGDVKLSSLIGFTVGLPSVLIALYVAILCGGLVAIVLWINKRFQRNLRIAYAPYLVLGAWLVLFNGPALIYAWVVHP